MQIILNRVEASSLNSSSADQYGIDYFISHYIKSDIKICAIGNEYDRTQVSLIDFYVDFQRSLTDCLIRGVDAAIRENYEDILSMSPSDVGCLLSDVSPPYPVSNLNKDYEQFSLSNIRQVVSLIENEIRSICWKDRQAILDFFERSQSPLLFNIIKIIDRSSIVRN